jgi:hypothetical protein
MNSDIITVRRAIAKVSRNFHILQQNRDFVWWEDDFSWNLFADTENAVEGGVSEKDENNITHTCNDGKPQPGPTTSGYTACKRCNQTMKTLYTEFFARSMRCKREFGMQN